jgi:hypothetical protein
LINIQSNRYFNSSSKVFAVSIALKTSIMQNRLNCICVYFT